MLYDLAVRALSLRHAVGLRAHGGGGDRRLRPRHARARLRHRSPVPASLQADRLGRVGRRRHSLLPVGHGAEGRPRDALGRRVHPPGQGRHDRSAPRCWRRAICSATARCIDEFVARFDKDIVRKARRPQFVAAKLAEREERLRRAGQSRYLVEPNVKDGKGGLRDLHTLFWIAKYVYRVHERRGADRARRVRSRRNTRCSAAPRISSGRCAATCISSPAAPRSGCRSTSSARSRCGSATRRIPACATSSAS